MSKRRPEPSDAIRAARRAVDGHRGAQITGDLLWDEQEQAWAFPVRISAATSACELIPTSTVWYFFVDPQYPWGTIEVHPAQEGGIDRTFYHQNHNGVAEPKRPWRTGNICVQSPALTLGRHGDDPDPKGDPSRILWYVDRAIEWIDRATRGELVAVGDNFELPQWNAIATTVGFVEDESTFAKWASNKNQYGLVEFAVLGKSSPLAVRRFLDASNTEILAPEWGTMVVDEKNVIRGGWLRLPSVPVVTPYGAPMTWGELFAVMAEMGVEPEKVMPKVLMPLRDGKAHILLIGFPIPSRFGDAPSRMHWQPLSLEQLSSNKKVQKGFSARDGSYWQGDLVSVFRRGKPIKWLTGRNWHIDEWGTRGLLTSTLRARKVLLLGAGALGSAVAELLVRGGVNDVAVVDNEATNAGNLVRHTLGVVDIGHGKAARLAARLNGLSPHARVEAIIGNFPLTKESDRRRADMCDLVIDCAGSDEVLAALSAEVRPQHTEYLSISLGRGPKRLYLFADAGTSFPAEAFWNATAPWLDRDRSEFDGFEFPWEGIGCWHPVFPAPAHAVWLAASIAVKGLDQFMSDGGVQGGLKVFALDAMSTMDRDQLADANACSA